MTAKEQALIKIKELVERFEEQLPVLKNARYKEHNLRQEYLNPFWEALGWDINNKQGKPQAYKEVEQEDTLKIENLRGAPDYCFRKSKDKRFFYLEAKKPVENIKENNAHALQTRTYGWNGNLSISILSDFEEFGLYDCSKKPKETDTVRTARLKYMTYKEYEKNFDFLWDTFSRDAVFGGSIDQFASKNIKRGKDTVDKEFLISLDNWRTELAENISLRNKNHIDEDQLNFAVQHIIDRLIFLRIAEDRSIEPYGNLKQQLSGDNFYANILKVFVEANNRYNSGLFDPAKDQITATLTIDNKVVKDIVSDMYYPKSPYLFDVISVEILGSAYEQFLGKTITINNRGKAQIELKPEVRKAGGVYYTPQYIVDYIVDNTVGKLLEDKTPKQASELKICDPACGSGSFLLGAYQHLLNWHKDYYLQNPNTKNPMTPDGNLTTSEKKRILLNNIYGVDIDANAVEVTKLSLLLKCMEGETQASIAHQMTMFKERVLPTLDNNIKSGNSLIDTDFYDSQLDFGEERKIKPFSWQKGFPDVFKNGGFDAVIGNPPYVTIGGKEETLFQKSEIQYLLFKYISNQYKPNLYAFFYEKGVQILRENGLLSFIVPRTLIDNVYYTKLREFFVNNTTIIKILKLNYEVFDDATTGGTSIFVLKNNKNNSKNVVFTKDVKNLNNFFINSDVFIKQDEILIGEFKSFSFLDKIQLDLIQKISKHNKIDYYCSVNNGVNTGNCAEILLSDIPKNEKYRKILEGKNINRYYTNWKGLWINYDPSLKYTINLKELKTKQNKIDFALRDEKIFNSIKIIIRQTGDRIIANIDFDNFITRHSTHCLINEYNNINMKYLLGVLNSKVTDFYYNYLIPEKGKAFAEVKGINLKQLPVPNISETNIFYHDQIVSFVDQLLEFNKVLQSETLDSKKEQIKRKIEHFEDKINEIVYKLYDLTEDEIKIIENG